MPTLLNVVNAKGWSWGLIAKDMLSRLDDGYQVVNMLKYGRIPVMMENAGVKVTVMLPAQPIDKELTEFFDLTLLQNVEAMELITSNKQRVIVRSGGMVINDKCDENRYNDQLAEVGAVIATNQQLFDIASKANKKAYLIPNGIDLDLFKPRPPVEKCSPPSGKFVAGFAGNIWGPGLKYKGYDLYVQATLGLFETVETKMMLHNHNQVPHKEMPEKFYHQIDCLILPSKGEGCSNVIMEALACGVPVICTKVGYHGFTLEDEKNCLFIDRDIPSIIKAINRLVAEPDLCKRLSENGREFAARNHDIALIAQKYDEVFQEVLRS